MRISPQKATFIFALFAAGVILCVGGVLATFGLLAPDQFYNAALFAIAVIVVLMPVFYFVSSWQARSFEIEHARLLVQQARIQEPENITADWLNSEQVPAEYLARHGSGKLTELLDGFGQGVLVLREGRVVYGNLSACKILGYDRRSLLGLDLQTISFSRLPTVDEAPPPMHQEAVLPITPIELKLKSKDGADIYLQTVCQQNNLDFPSGLTLTFFDVTAQKFDENSLRRQRRFQTVGRLSSGVAHDFNNFLAIILGNLELIGESLSKGDAPDPDKLQKRIGKSLDAAERGARLVEQLVSYAQKQMLDPAKLELDAFLREIELLLKSILGSAIAFEMKFNAAGQSIVVDPVRLEDALINMLLILGEGARRVDRLKIETSAVSLTLADEFATHDKVEPGRYLVLCVDQGVKGIDENFFAKAEDPFMGDMKASDPDLLSVSALIGFIKQSGGFYQFEKRPGGENLIRLYFPCWTGDSEEKNAPTFLGSDLDRE